MTQALEPFLQTVSARIIASADELTELDSAIGDADHGLNMKRGFEAVLAEMPNIVAKPTGEALKSVGMTLVMKVGGASGPLYGTLFMTLGKELPEQPTMADMARALHAAMTAQHGLKRAASARSASPTAAPTAMPRCCAR